MLRWPSPWPETSAVPLAKNSTLNQLFASLANVPSMWIWLPVVAALLSTGKFCRPFAPLSASGAASLAVTPSLARSIPRPLLP